MEKAKKAVKDINSKQIKELSGMKGSGMRALTKYVMDCVLILFKLPVDKAKLAMIVMNTKEENKKTPFLLVSFEKIDI